MKPKTMTKCLALAALCSAAIQVPLPAAAQQERLIAGWDFMQYSNLGFLSIDGMTLVNTLAANHSDLDATNGCGIEANQYGTMYLNGSFGSTSTPLSFEGLDPFQPTDVPPNSSLLSNADQAPLGFGSQSGTAACNQAVIEQMPGANCSNVAMVAYDGVSVVFGANRGAPVNAPGDWSVSFAGKTLVAGNSSATVQFSPDGTTYSNVATAELSATDTRYRFALGAAHSPTAYVKLVFGAQAEGSEASIDNVGIAVPEPASGACAALFGLGSLRLLRERRPRDH